MKKKINNMKKEILEWDYNGLKAYGKYLNCDVQEDWNQTLMTMINQMAAKRVKYYDDLGKSRGKLPPLSIPFKFNKLMETLEYYDAKKKILSGRYIFEYNVKDINYIEFDGFKLKILNYKTDYKKMKKKLKILIIGHMRHGKDTVAEIIEEHTGMSFKSSSEMAAEIFIYDELKNKYGYSSFMECFEDRMSHRAEWHDLIKNYNNQDKAKLAKEILKFNDMYVGMRSQVEIDKCIEDGIFNMIIGVYDPNKPLEPKDSFDINLFTSSDIIIPTGNLKNVKEKVMKLCDYILKH